ncbi:MAG: fucose isomerase, partial [Bacteroidota bacterium]
MLTTTLGVLVGNRGFFPAHLCESGRETILKVIQEEGIRTIALPIDATKYGAVESYADAQKCASLFREHR